MKMRLFAKTAFVATVMVVLLSRPALAEEMHPLIKEPRHNIYHVVKHKTLREAADQLANRSGITFKINPALEGDEINLKLAADDWRGALIQLLAGYNYTTVLENDAVKSVVVTGRNGSGQDHSPAASEPRELLVVAPDYSKKLPGRYKGFRTGSVFNVKLPLSELSKVPLGGDLTLDLPIGQYKVRHDELVDDGDGTSTWIGYLDDEGKGYRVYLSQGDAGVMGNVYTPDGVYNIESVDGQTVIVDIDKSGLTSAGFDHDEVEPTMPGGALQHMAASTLDHLAISKAAQTRSATANATTAGAAMTTSGTTTAASIATATPVTEPVVDLMVLYTTTMQTAEYAKQRIKYLVNISNQAYKDSKINMRLRLVHTRPTRYIESNTNSQALSDLANGRGAFAGTAVLRNQYGADLVVLLRPLYAKTSGSCGTAYVGFAYGGAANPASGFGAVSDGYSKDALSNYYCGTNTFTHEIGHTLGNVHDREFSNAEGKFSYSYAWGINGRFGTIMSYYGPSVMLFSTPALATQCAGTPCGFPEGSAKASDQSRTINYTAPVVGRYLPTRVSVPVIQ